MTESRRGWLIRDLTGPARDLFELSAPPDAASSRELRILEPDDETLVIGSSQVVAAGVLARLTVPWVRRRTGGAAVLIGRPDVLWFDVVVPVGDALSSDDVVRGSLWLGQALQAVLASIGVAPSDLAMHEGRVAGSAWSSTVCFAGLGPGEVTCQHSKVVGIAQRKNRSGTLLQCAVLLADQQHRIPALLVDSSVGERLPPRRGLSDVLGRPPEAAYVDVREAILRWFTGTP